MTTKKVSGKKEESEVKAASFPVFDNTSEQEDVELIVELGSCDLPIKKALELTKNSVIKLNQLMGKPVAIYANKKPIAYGEIIVIDDNYSIKITKINLK